MMESNRASKMVLKFLRNLAGDLRQKMIRGILPQKRLEENYLFNCPSQQENIIGMPG